MAREELDHNGENCIICRATIIGLAIMKLIPFHGISFKKGQQLPYVEFITW